MASSRDSEALSSRFTLEQVETLVRCLLSSMCAQHGRVGS